MEQSNIYDRLSELYLLPAACRLYIMENVKEDFYPKNQVILSAGQKSKRIWYVRQGLAMQYVFKDIDKTPYRFWQEGELIADVSSFFMQVPAESYIELLEPCILQSINYDRWDNLIRMYPEMQTCTRLIIEDYHAFAEKKALDLLTLTAEERYCELHQSYPSLFQKIPSDYIAAYLGISTKTLSRIKAKYNGHDTGTGPHQINFDTN